MFLITLCILQEPDTILSCSLWIAGTSCSDASEDKTSSWDLWWCSDGFGVFICVWWTFWSSRWISWRSDFRQVVIYVAKCPNSVVSFLLLLTILGPPLYHCYKAVHAALIKQCLHMRINQFLSSVNFCSVYKKKINFNYKLLIYLLWMSPGTLFLELCIKKITLFGQHFLIASP